MEAIMSAPRTPRSLLAWVLGFVLLTGGCGGSSDSGGSTTSDCSTQGRNQQILDVFRSWYYWYTSIPANLDPAAYAQPQDLVDAIRKAQPSDRYSFIITHTESQAFFGAGQYIGYGFSFQLTTDNEMELMRVYRGSPADQAGLVRSDRITTVNGASVPSLVAAGTLSSTLAGDTAGHTITITFVDTAGGSHDASLTSAVVTRPNVDDVVVLDAGGRRVGYFFFDSFIDLSNAQLDAAFAQFVNQGVQDLVIDLRYNGGGELTVAQHLASLIAGNAYVGKPLVTLTFNDKHQSSNDTTAFARVDSPLTLSRVFFITTGGSASASEVMINGLRPYIDVVTVGSTTFGKPVGENIFNVCTYDAFPITFKLENAAGFGDYFDGLAPTCTADDDVTRQLGDPEEASLASALHYIRTGSCGSGTAASGRRPAPKPVPAHRTYGWRDLQNAY
jgi:C-terminal processing protease CtpA/Prc